MRPPSPGRTLAEDVHGLLERGFEDVTEVGRGSCAVVYRARQAAFNRDVAVKVLDVTTSAGPARQRWQRECRALGTVSHHPHIVALLDAGTTASGRPFLVMDYASRGALGSHLAARGPLPWEVVLQIGVEIAAALEVAHRAHVLHRDVKPENVLVSAFGQVQLADFGIARLRGGIETRSGHVTASLVHAPPEILAGQPPSAVADVYCLASTLCTLLRGSPPFAHPDDESIVPLLGRIGSQPAPGADELGVSEPIARALGRALAKAPGARHASARAFGRDLQQAQAELGLVVTPMIVDVAGPDGSAAPRPPQPTAGPARAAVSPPPVGAEPSAVPPLAAAPLPVRSLSRTRTFGPGPPLLARPPRRAVDWTSALAALGTALALAAAIAYLITS